MTEEIVIDDPPTKHIEFHDPSSIYHGLPLKKQLALSKLRRGTTKAPKTVTKHFHKANDNDYAMILLECVNCLIHQSEYAVSDVRLDRIKINLKLVFSYRRHFNKDWPRGVPMAYGDWWVVIQYNVDVLINYLHKIGKSSFTAAELRKNIWKIKAEQDRWLFLQDWSIPLCEMEFLNDVVPAQPKDKAMKGRRTYRKSGLHKKPKPPEDSSEEMLDKVVEGDV